MVTKGLHCNLKLNLYNFLSKERVKTKWDQIKFKWNKDKGSQEFFEGRNLILLLTQGQMQNFITQGQTLLGEK